MLDEKCKDTKAAGNWHRRLWYDGDAVTIHRLALIVLCLLPAVLPAQTPLLRVSPDGRHLQWADGRPFLYLGDTAWELVHRLKTEEAELYLQNRAEKGFTVIQMVLLPLQGDVNDPNAYGEVPLLNGNPATPNEAFTESFWGSATSPES